MIIQFMALRFMYMCINKTSCTEKLNVSAICVLWFTYLYMMCCRFQATTFRHPKLSSNLSRLFSVRISWQTGSLISICLDSLTAKASQTLTTATANSQCGKAFYYINLFPLRIVHPFFLKSRGQLGVKRICNREDPFPKLWYNRRSFIPCFGVSSTTLVRLLSIASDLFLTHGRPTSTAYRPCIDGLVQ